MPYQLWKPHAAALVAAVQAEEARPGVYRITAAGELQRLATDIERPNGIQLSADEKTLYVVGHGSAYKIALLAQGYGGRAK